MLPLLRSRLLQDLSRSVCSSYLQSTCAVSFEKAKQWEDIAAIGHKGPFCKFGSSMAAATETATAGAKVDGSTVAQRLIVFVLGGPGSGKGTQCSRLVEDFDLRHLSAGELLRAHMASGSPEGKMIDEMIKEGKIVPSEVTVGLLQKAMDDSKETQFLIDGFPRNQENQENFVKITGMDCEFVLFCDCPEEVMEQRLLARQQGRTDDNMDTIRKRFQTFMNSTLPIVEHYQSLGKVRRVDGNLPPDEVYAIVKPFFKDFKPKDQ